jgi:hypothetical protein
MAQRSCVSSQHFAIGDIIFHNTIIDLDKYNNAAN